MLKKYKILFCVTVISFIPSAIYFLKFHGSLSDKSSDWSAFGSYFGGVYAPIFSFLSVIVLIKTLREMQENNKNQNVSNNRNNRLNDIKWLTQLLRDTFDRNQGYKDIRI
ncbi:hypothetical protein AAGW04_12385 [Pectobacterium aroidearum]|uniref:hypothetical protein n=1 Tax=Pectobacterium aroidearum TaxID=1201031 RepID=UPI0031592D3B